METVDKVHINLIIINFGILVDLFAIFDVRLIV